MSQPLLYDPRYHTFESWASLMCEQYAANQLEIPTSHNRLEDVGQRTKGYRHLYERGDP
jgi:hypothetical protein